METGTRRGRGRPPKAKTVKTRMYAETVAKVQALCRAGGGCSADVLERLLRAPLAREFAKVTGSES